MVGRRGEAPLVPPYILYNFKLDGAVTLWFLAVVAGRPPKVAVGFHPSASAEPSRPTISSRSDD